MVHQRKKSGRYSWRWFTTIGSSCTHETTLVPWREVGRDTLMVCLLQATCPTLALNRIPVFTADLAFNVRVTAFGSHGYIRQCVCVEGGVNL